MIAVLFVLESWVLSSLGLFILGLFALQSVLRIRPRALCMLSNCLPLSIDIFTVKVALCRGWTLLVERLHNTYQGHKFIPVTGKNTLYVLLCIRYVSTVYTCAYVLGILREEAGENKTSSKGEGPEHWLFSLSMEWWSVICHPHGDSQLSSTLDLRDPMLSCGLWGHTFGAQTYM